MVSQYGQISCIFSVTHGGCKKRRDYSNDYEREDELTKGIAFFKAEEGLMCPTWVSVCLSIKLSSKTYPIDMKFWTHGEYAKFEIRRVRKLAKSVGLCTRHGCLSVLSIDYPRKTYQTKLKF